MRNSLRSGKSKNRSLPAALCMQNNSLRFRKQNRLKTIITSLKNFEQNWTRSVRQRSYFCSRKDIQKIIWKCITLARTVATPVISGEKNATVFKRRRSGFCIPPPAWNMFYRWKIFPPFPMRSMTKNRKYVCLPWSGSAMILWILLEMAAKTCTFMVLSAPVRPF